MAEKTYKGGACQPEKHFRTMAEAEAAGAAMIERARDEKFSKWLQEQK